MSEKHDPVKRIFKIGATRIVADEQLSQLSPEEARRHLQSMYPEVAQATIRERQEGTTQIVEFLPQPGRKG